MFASGHAEGSDKLHSGSTVGGFYVADPQKPRPQGWADEVQFYDRAYIENAHGATTETVYAY